MKQIQKFAQPTITSTTYSGESAGQFIAAALLSARTLDNKLVTIMPNVKYKSVIQKIAVANIVNDGACDFATSGAVTLTEQVITPKELQVNLELCKANFVASWEALSLGFSAFDEIPKSFTDYLISYVGGNVAQATETAIWQGTASNGSFLGFQSILSASVAASTGVIAAGTGFELSGSITAANVVTKLTAVQTAIPNSVYGKEDLVIYIGSGVAKAYQTAMSGNGSGGLGANGFNNQMNIGEKELNFQGIPLALCPGLGDNKIVAAQKSNLFFGTGLLSDYNTVKVLDMADIDGSQNFRIIMRYTAGVQVGILGDIVYYGAYA